MNLQAESEYLVHTISVQCLLLDGTTLDSVVRSTAMRRTPPNASEHRRNSAGCLEMTYLPSDAGKITLISYLFSVLSSLLLNLKCLFLLNYYFTLFNVSFSPLSMTSFWWCRVSHLFVRYQTPVALWDSVVNSVVYFGGSE